jgi:transcriptional regulator of heat shock response
MEYLTERQKKILEIVIREYIEGATPISSKFIEESYNLGVSPATIRAELYDLARKGYLYQPHTSAGRIPTDKGYRFFVDALDEIEVKKLEYKLAKEINKISKEIQGKINFIREYTRLLANTSSTLTISYFPKENILLKEGWSGVVGDPEFESVEKIRDFMVLVNDFEENIDSFMSPKDSKCIRVYIGDENPFSGKKDFSVMISSCNFSRKKGLLAIMGPKRMPYDRNIYLVESIIKLLNR